MAQSSPISEALDRLINALAPGPPYFDSDLKSVRAGSHSIATAQLAHALLRESYNVQSVAVTLWDALLGIRTTLSVKNDTNLLEDAVIVESADDHGNPLVVSTTQSDTWQSLASSTVRSDSIRRTVVDWAAQWFNIMLLPMQGKSRTPSAAGTNSTGRAQQALKQQLLLRDGYTSPMSNHTDWDTPESQLDYYDEAVGEAKLIVAHIIPFSMNKRPDTLRLLEIFSGGRVTVASLIGRNINKVSNAFLVDPNTHASFDRFHFAIRVKISEDFSEYTMECFSARKTPPIIKQKAGDGSPILFGRIKQDDLPDPHLCNLHHALGRVLHAAGAAEIVDKILKDEDDFFQGRAQLETVPSLGSEVATAYISRKLCSSAQAY